MSATSGFVGDETINLLHQPLPEVPSIGYVDLEEDEVFFGQITGIEKQKCCTRRRTLVVDDGSRNETSPETSRNEEGENKENVSGMTTTPTPSPRKVNVAAAAAAALPMPKTRTKLGLTTRRKEVKRASELLAHLPNRPPLGDIDEDDDDDDEKSILDVYNDQMFDDSVFTEYDSVDLDSMTDKISEGWKEKKERRKTGNLASPDNISDLVAEMDTSKMSTCSDWFDTTRDEMILYERFGEDYDVIVGKMSREEKVKLKAEVDKSTPKDVKELLGDDDVEEEEPQPQPEATQLSTRKVVCEKVDGDNDVIVGQLEATLSTREVSCEKFDRYNDVIFGKLSNEEKMELGIKVDDEVTLKEPEAMVTTHEALGENFDRDTDVISGKMSNEEMVEPEDGMDGATPDYVKELLLEDPEVEISMTTTTSSFVLDKPDNESIFEPPISITPSRPLQQQQRALPSYQRTTVASRLRASPSKILPPPLPSTPSAGFKLTAGRKAGLLNMRNITSPVSQYINSNPVPPIMRSIRPVKASPRFRLDDAAEGEPVAAAKPTKYYAPLPEARYVSSKVALEQKLAPDVTHKELPKAFGTVNEVQAVVVRHVGRMRVPKGMPESDLVASSIPSPNNEVVGQARIKRILHGRESMLGPDGTQDESTMELSIREVKEIKKPTTNFKK